MMLDVTDRLVVIVGGGAVAARKAKGVLEAGGTRVRCVSPAFDSGMPEAVERVAEPYDARHLDGAGLVFAATDLAAVNDEVVRDARAGRAGQPGGLRRRPTGRLRRPREAARGAGRRRVTGGSPALAVLVRDGLRERWDPRWSRMAEVMLGLRRTLIERLDNPQVPRDALRNWPPRKPWAFSTPVGPRRWSSGSCATPLAPQRMTCAT